jgi:hypothetical protein
MSVATGLCKFIIQTSTLYRGFVCFLEVLNSVMYCVSLGLLLLFIIVYYIEVVG